MILQIIIGLLAVFGELYLLYNVFEFAKNNENPNPFSLCDINYPIGLLGCYLIGIYILYKYMKNRDEAYDIKGFMIIYNLYQTVFNIVSVCGFIYFAYKFKVKPAGTLFDPNDREVNLYLGFFIYMHYQNKYIEYFDTIFMLLRKKFQQVSFLHVQHHSVMAGIWFTVLIFQPGGDSYFGALANSIIHSVMYLYYLLRLLNIPFPLKKYITQLQLFQFLCCFSQAWYVVLVSKSTKPYWLPYVQIGLMISKFFFLYIIYIYI